MNERDTSPDCKLQAHVRKGSPNCRIWYLLPSVTYRIPWFLEQDQCFWVDTLRSLVLTHFYQQYGSL